MAIDCHWGVSAAPPPATLICIDFNTNTWPYNHVLMAYVRMRRGDVNKNWAMPALGYRPHRTPGGWLQLPPGRVMTGPRGGGHVLLGGQSRSCQRQDGTVERPGHRTSGVKPAGPNGITEATQSPANPASGFELHRFDFESWGAKYSP